MIRRILQHQLLRLSPWKHLYGINVHNGWFWSKTKIIQINNNISYALLLIKTYSPNTFDRIVKDINSIVIHDAHGAHVAHYVKELHMIVIKSDHILLADDGLESIEGLASTIVHEAQHARLYRFGFGYEEHERGRIEEVCIKSQRNFGKRIPNGYEVVKDANIQLSVDLSVVYSDDYRFLHKFKELEKLNLPKWFLRFVLNKHMRKKKAKAQEQSFR